MSNILCLFGTLVAEPAPEQKFTKAGKSFVNFEVHDNGDPERACHYSCTAWEETADDVLKISPGTPVYVEGMYSQRRVWSEKYEKTSTFHSVTARIIRATAPKPAAPPPSEEQNPFDDLPADPFANEG